MSRITMTMTCEICKAKKRIQAKTEIKFEHLVKVSGWDNGNTKPYHDFCPTHKHLATQETLF